MSYIPQNIGYKEIKSLDDVFESYGYVQKDGSLISPYSFPNFMDEFYNNYQKIIHSNKKNHIDYYNSLFKAAEKTFSNFLDNDEFFNLTKNEYAKLNIHFKRTNPETYEEEYYDLNSLDQLDHNYVKNLILQKLKGNLAELINNYYFYDTVNPNGRIDVRKGANLFNYFIDDKPDEAKYYIVNDADDGGIDALIIWYKDQNPIGSLSIQIKYRTSGLKNLNVKECVNKMTNVMGNTKIGDVIKWNESKNSNHKYAIIINDTKEKIFDKSSEIWFENKTHESLRAGLTQVFDLKFIKEKIFGGFLNEKTVEQIFEMIRLFNKYCK